MAKSSMTKRAKPAAKRGRAAPKSPKVAAGELLTLLDFVRYAVSRFIEARLVFAHGTPDPVAEAAFAAAEFLMDYLKANAPFWKREESAGGTGWVDAHSRDDAAAARWTKS